MRVVFIGATGFGLRCLNACLEVPGIDIAGIVTAENFFRISYAPIGVKNILHVDFTQFAEDKSIPYLKLSDSMNNVPLIEAVRNWRPDVFIVVGWYHLIPQSWLQIAPTYGLHASLLPNYSGGAPLVWAIINGEKETGITMFRMDNGVDSGPIVGQMSEPIYPSDTIATLYARIEEHGVSLVKQTLASILDKTITFRAQDESLRRIYSQRCPEDGLIDWGNDVGEIERFVRAQTKPYPGAFGVFNKHKITFWKVRLDRSPHQLPNGLVHKHKGEFAISCKNGRIVPELISFNEKHVHGNDFESIFKAIDIQS